MRPASRKATKSATGRISPAPDRAARGRWWWPLLGLLLLLAAAPQRVWAGPQPYTSAGGEVGKEYVLGALERLLPADWVIVQHSENRVPYLWSGADEALLVKIEDRSLTIHHPTGFDYHPFIRLYFCPSAWVGNMQETDYYGDRQPAFLLGENHIFRVFYQARGMLRWEGVYGQLAVAFDLTQPPVDRRLRQTIDMRLRTRLAHRITSVMHDLRDDVLDRLAGIDRQGNLLYVEYVATVSAPPATPGSPPLLRSLRQTIEEESAGLVQQLFLIAPEISTIYLRRVCDNRMFDCLLDREIQATADPTAATSF